MSEAITAEAAYRREVLLSYDSVFMYNTYFVGKDECCVECNAPESVVEEFIAVRRNLDVNRMALIEHCGYTWDDIEDLTDNWVVNILRAGLKQAANNQEDVFLEKYAANFDV